MESRGKPLLSILAALVIGLVVAGAPAAYFYLQNSSLSSKNASLQEQESLLNTQVASLRANQTSLRAQVAALQANVTAMVALKAKLSANLTASTTEISTLNQEISSDMSQISTLNQEVNTDQSTINYDTSQLNIYSAQLTKLQGIASHENLSAVQIIQPSEPLSWTWSSCSGVCLNAALYGGPYNVTDFAGYLRFVFTNPNPSNVQVLVNVTWDGYGVKYSSVQTITGTGNATFPVLLTNDLNFYVEPMGPAGSNTVNLAILWYD